MATLIGGIRRLHAASEFIVEIDGFARARFMSCSEPEKTVEVNEHREGGSSNAEKYPGLVSYNTVTLLRGASMDLDAWNWMQDVHDSEADTGENTPGYERNVNIIQLDRARRPVQVVELERAWPTVFSPGGWDNDSSDRRIVKLELVYFDFNIRNLVTALF